MNIHYISPYDSSPQKNIGGAINCAIEQLNAADEDWIVHVDQDVLWLLHDSKKHFEHILRAPNAPDIVGPMTNRLANPHQLSPTFFDEKDLEIHIQHAKILFSENRYNVQPTNLNLAAFTLAFKVSVWKRVGKFVENDIRFDSQFCINAKSAGFKLGIAIGIYVFHLYRMCQEGEARKNYKHLLPEG